MGIVLYFEIGDELVGGNADGLGWIMVNGLVRRWWGTGSGQSLEWFLIGLAWFRIHIEVLSWKAAGLRLWPALVIRVFFCRICCPCCSCFWYFTTKPSKLMCWIDQPQRIFCSFFFVCMMFLFFFLHRSTEKRVHPPHSQLQISLESSTTEAQPTRQVICADFCFYLV